MLPKPPPEPPADTTSPTSPSSSSERTSTENTQHYLRLQALGKLVAVALQDGTDIVQSCAVYLNLEQTAKDYTDGLNILRSFNICLESSDVSGGRKQLDLSYPLDIPRTRWKDTEPSKFSRWLFRILCDKVSKCPGGQKQQHQAMLRLNGFQLEDHPLAFDMFFLPCRRPNYWQESRFTPRPK
jgi:hypothetical protein